MRGLFDSDISYLSLEVFSPVVQSQFSGILVDNTFWEF